MKKEEYLNTVVNFRDTEHVLKDILHLCQPGDIIEGLDIKFFDNLLHKIAEIRQKPCQYSTDRSYGKWRFILFGQM